MADVKKWLDRVPALESGVRHPGMPPEEAAKLFDEILAGGKDAITEVIDTLNEIDDGKDHKTRFVLHALATHTGAPERKAERAKLEAVYAAELEGDRSASVKTFLVRQLQYFATATSVPALAAQLRSDDPYLMPAAAAALTAIGKPAQKALRELRGKVDGPAKIAIEHALDQIERGVTA